MSDLEHIADHSRRAILNLNGPFCGKPRIASIVWALAEEVQQIEDAAKSVADLFSVEAAGLEQLKILGKIVGQRYGSGELETYRAQVKARAFINRSCGTASDLASVFAALYSSDLVIADVYSGGPRTVSIVVEYVSDSWSGIDSTTTLELLRESKAAHERLQFYSPVVPEATSSRRGEWNSVTTPRPLAVAIEDGFGRASDAATGMLMWRVAE